MNKIKTQEEIQNILNDLKEDDKKIVAINGSFDILHLGHEKILQTAKSQGDVLVVLLNSDESVRKYKGPFRPINSEDVRAENIASFEVVDYVVLFDEINPKKVLDIIKPDIYCQGSDWGKNCIEREVVERNGGEIYVVERSESVSSSDFVPKEIKSAKKAVFFDRDGVINFNEPEYVHRIEDFKFIPQTLGVLKELSKTDFKIVIITNQSGIGRGYYSEDDFHVLNNWMITELAKQDIRIDKVYYCPHTEVDACECRKPGIGMFLRAVKDLQISLAKSFLVGDSSADVLAGREANIQTIKFGDKMPAELKLEPNYYVDEIGAAVDIIMEHGT